MFEFERTRKYVKWAFRTRTQLFFWAKVKRLNSQKPVVDDEECHFRVVEI